MDPTKYDSVTLSAQFSSIQFSDFTETYPDAFTLTPKSSVPVIQIMTQSLLRIWKMIFKSYSSASKDQMLNPENIKNFIVSEITYSRHTWNLPEIEKPIFNSFRRLKAFIQHIDNNDQADSRKTLIKQFVPRVIAIILRYNLNTAATNSWTSKTNKLLHSIIHSCEERPDKIITYRSGLFDESPTQIDIDQLISQLPDNTLKLIQKQNKEKMNLALQSLIESDKNMSSPLNKNLLSSIYKDSKQFKYFASDLPSTTSYLDTIQIEAKRKSILLENISSLERLNSGHWDENSFSGRSSSRVRTKIEKRFPNRKNRIMTREFNVKESITEEPEGLKHDSEEISDDESNDEDMQEETEEEPKETLEIVMKLEELAKIKESDIDSEVRPKFVRQNTRINDVVGRKRLSKLF